MVITMNVKTELQKIMDKYKLTHPLSYEERNLVMNAMEGVIRQMEDEDESLHSLE